ncbi:zinc finger protein 300-like [Bacillus rossius redtenbacheri]|uniref:zinc finger protein 300-like n=1 Tax=Bacillus rossius redtenbacheri TaxID=93214 RepID=UPI002FDCCCB0
MDMFSDHIKLEPSYYSDAVTNHNNIEPPTISLEDSPDEQPVITKPEPVSRAKPQECKVCGKVLSSASSYYVHMKLHSGNKPYQCTSCEASFCRKPYLEVHMRTHTGERPFQCEQCLKRFTQKSSLNTHKRVHTGERPYSCDICNKRFAVKSYVTAHRWSHVADKPLTCDMCNLTFTAKSQFVIHIRTHAVNANFECNVCGRLFVKDSYLIRHHNRVHREGNNAYNPACEVGTRESLPVNSCERAGPASEHPGLAGKLVPADALLCSSEYA